MGFLWAPPSLRLLIIMYVYQASKGYELLAHPACTIHSTSSLYGPLYLIVLWWRRRISIDTDYISSYIYIFVQLAL